MAYDPAREWREAIHLFDAGKLGEAAQKLKTLRKGDRRFAPAAHLLGVCEYRLGREAQGMALLREALQLAPRLVPALNDYANMLDDTGRHGEAERYYRKALECEPSDRLAAMNLARLVGKHGDEAEARQRHADYVARFPDDAIARWQRAVFELGCGRLADGWPDYRLRWQVPATVFDSARHDRGLPAWNGALLPPGQRLWVWSEQGIGDVLLYGTVLRDALAAGHAITLGLPRRLVALFRRSFPGLPVAALEDAAPPECAACAAQLPIADLAAHFRPDLESFGTGAAYLAADPALRDELRARYQTDRPGRKLVGLSWKSGNQRLSRYKSSALADFMPLFARPDCAFVNLQYGDTAAERTALLRRNGIDLLHDPAIDPLGDLDPFAAQVAAMDAVVTTSGTTAHFAGALGVPGLVLVPRGSGSLWYWFRDGGQTPWYASLKLCRQAAPGDWKSAIAAAADALPAILPPQ